MQVDRRLLAGLGVPCTRIDRFLPGLRSALPERGIDTPLRIAHFFAQVLHESALLKAVRENLDYSDEALLRVFSSYFWHHA